MKAVGICLVGAIVCGYATLCLLYSHGEWQLLLHPSHTVTQTPASAGIGYSEIRFGAAETGQPRLAGWWIPANSSPGAAPRYAGVTVLYLHDGSGSLSDSVSALAILHRIGMNVFAIDYRGFGASDTSANPSEARMSEDAAAALEYLVSTLHIPAKEIVPYGTGLGASLAARLAQAHPELPAVILDNPVPDAGSVAATQSPRFIPARLLFGHPFDIAGPLATLGTPKLLIAGGPNSSSSASDPVTSQDRFRHAANPSSAVALPPTGGETQYQAALQRFLDQYLPAHRP
jgi:pimeloyl-ACP methyl ester carboxylesterase